ncbi:hypothetical protein JCM8097_001288 [Rhodosporidiobolus ruineniae]
MPAATALPLPRELVTAVTGVLPRSSTTQRLRLANDLASLYWGLRTAVLVDCVMLSQAEAEALGRALNTQNDLCFTVYEPATEQTIVVNRLLARKTLEKRPGSGGSACIEVGGREPVLLPHIPPSSASILSAIASYDNSSPFLLLPPVDRPWDLVPVVGCLLDYPVQYSLASSENGRNCLGGRELVVVEAQLMFADLDGASRRLLSFSYPASFADTPEPPLSSPLLVSQLSDLLEERLEAAQATFPELRDSRIEVVGHRTVLDQVAL